MNKQELINRLKEILTTPSEIEGHDFDYGHDFGIERAISLVEDLDEPVISPESEKPVIPKYVADWIEWCKKHNVSLLGSTIAVCNNNKNIRALNASGWATKNQETFTKAWFYGYEVEKEKQYVVVIPDDGRNGFIQLWKNREGKLLFNFEDKIRYGKVHLLTEKEIKQKDKRLWQFAKEVNNNDD